MATTDGRFYDQLEFRDNERRDTALLDALPGLLRHALANAPGIAADLAGIGPALCQRRDIGESHRQGEREKARPRADHFFIGSHCRVSWPQNSTQSS